MQIERRSNMLVPMTFFQSLNFIMQHERVHSKGLSTDEYKTFKLFTFEKVHINEYHR